MRIHGSHITFFCSLSAKIIPLVAFVIYPMAIHAQMVTANKKSTPQQIRLLPDSAMVRLSDIDPTLIFDIRYATENNFIRKKIYPCPDVMLRKDAAFALKRANELLKAKKYRIKVFDAYRPPSAQWKLWEHTPVKLYVTDPRKGSKHSMGISVDITLIDESGREIDMGSAYDFFGQTSHHDYQSLPETTLASRSLLKTTMESVGFTPIKSEWWHYNYYKLYSIVEIPFDCRK